jgi:hypothetical protein
MNKQTLGQRRIRVDSSRPCGDNAVDKINIITANLIDQCEAMKDPTNPEKTRCAELAQAAYEEAAMWAIKAATFQYENLAK